MNSLFDEFRTICSHLNQVGITPTLMGSLGFEYRSNEELAQGRYSTNCYLG